jgi:hypothetical protein
LSAFFCYFLFHSAKALAKADLAKALEVSNEITKANKIRSSVAVDELEVENKKLSQTVDRLEAELATNSLELSAKNAEIRTLKATVEAQQGQLSKLSDSSLPDNYEQTIEMLTQRIESEHAKQLALQEVSRSLSLEITKLQEMHRGLQTSAQTKWVSRRNIKTEKLELRSLQQERCVALRVPL